MCMLGAPQRGPNVGYSSIIIISSNNIVNANNDSRDTYYLSGRGGPRGAEGPNEGQQVQS